MNKVVSIGMLVASSIVLTVLTASPIANSQLILTIPEFPIVISLLCTLIACSVGLLMLKRGLR